MDALSDDDISHAAVEAEALVWTHPALSDEQWTRHVQAVCGLHREAGHELLLIAQTLETDEDTTQLKQAVGADEYLLVRLEAKPATLVERIIDREPANWSGLPELVEHAQRLAASLRALRGVDLVVSTEGQRPETVAHASATPTRAVCSRRRQSDRQGRRDARLPHRRGSPRCRRHGVTRKY